MPCRCIFNSFRVQFPCSVMDWWWCHQKHAPKVFLSWIYPGPPIIVSDFSLSSKWKNHNYQASLLEDFSSGIARMVYFANCWSCIHPNNVLENKEHQGSRQLKSLLSFCRLSPTISIIFFFWNMMMSSLSWTMYPFANFMVITVYSFWSWIPNDSSGLLMLWKLASG
jgi:hypothetical protein